MVHYSAWWTLTKDLERRPEAAEMWYIRRIMRISWAEKKSNVYKNCPLKNHQKKKTTMFGAYKQS